IDAGVKTSFPQPAISSYPFLHIMAPLILHNVPDDELYVGEDGVQRPYAMVFPYATLGGSWRKDYDSVLTDFTSQDGHPSAMRPRRGAPEKGSFGKSTRRSRSKTGTPVRREDPTSIAADKIWSDWQTAH